MRLLWFTIGVGVILLMFTVLSDNTPTEDALSPDELALREAIESTEPSSPQSTSPADGSTPFKRQAGEARRYPTSATLNPSVIDNVCGVTTATTGADLVNLFGEPDQKLGSAEDGFLSMLWQRDSFGAQALFDDDYKLKTLSGYSRGAGVVQGDTRLPRPDFSELAAMDQPSLANVEALLGPGVLTGAEWHRGIDVAASVAASMRDDIREDHCDMAYSWLIDGIKSPVRLVFDRRDRLVENAFVMLARRS